MTNCTCGHKVKDHICYQHRNLRERGSCMKCFCLGYAKKTHLDIREIFPQDPKRKTKKYLVHSRYDGAILGAISWYGGWRQYVFLPHPDTIWSDDCLLELSEFLKQLKEARKKKNNGAK